MYIILHPGERLSVQFHETDGEIVVDYDSKGDKKLTVETDWPDTQGRAGVIYCEDFNAPLENAPVEVAVYEEQPLPHVSHKMSDDQLLHFINKAEAEAQRRGLMGA